MQWTAEQKEILSIWHGRIPINLLVSFIGKSKRAVEQYAHKNDISLSFSGSGKKRLSAREETERLLKSGKYRNNEIAQRLNVTQHYVSNVKQGLKKPRRATYRQPPKQHIDNLLNAIFN